VNGAAIGGRNRTGAAVAISLDPVPEAKFGYTKCASGLCPAIFTFLLRQTGEEYARDFVAYGKIIGAERKPREWNW